MKEPKTLFFDIETSPCIAIVWGTGKTHISYDQIQKEVVIMTISYMWDTDKKPTSLTFKQNAYKMNQFDDESDKQLLKEFSKVYNQADIVVAHNGKRFDIPKLRSRLVKYGLPDLDVNIVADTYLQSRGIGFTNRKLDSLGKFLGLGRKGESGLSMWLDIMHGDTKALKDMVKYNAQDVVVLKDLYHKLKPYCKTPINYAIFNGDNTLCPHCGDKGLFKDGTRLTSLGRKQVYQCKSCGRKSTDGKNLLANIQDYKR